MKLSLRIHLPFSNSLLFLCILILSIPVLSPGKDFGYYAVYRASEQRCLLIANISHMKAGDHVYGGPYSIQEGLEILRKSCPIPLQEAGDWFAVKRKEDCWLIEGVAGLNPGDTILEGNLSRVMAEILLYEECGSFQVLEAGETFSPPSPPPEKEKPPPLLPPAPAMEWQKTEVDWVDRKSVV